MTPEAKKKLEAMVAEDEREANMIGEQGPEKDFMRGAQAAWDLAAEHYCDVIIHLNMQASVAAQSYADESVKAERERIRLVLCKYFEEGSPNGFCDLLDPSAVVT